MFHIISYLVDYYGTGVFWDLPGTQLMTYFHAFISSRCCYSVVSCVSRMLSRALAVAIIIAGLLQLTSDQIAWSLSGILILGMQLLCVYF